MLRSLQHRLRSGLGISSIERAQQEATRDMRAVIMGQGLGGVHINVDNFTARLPALRKSTTNPIIVPSGQSWQSGAVFDGRPIWWRGRQLIYFCAQQSYRTDAHLFIGLAEYLDDEWRVADVPVIVPDIETRGIDIPAFTVLNDRIVGVYFDDYGPLRTGRGTDANMVVVISEDGSHFSKHTITLPMSGKNFTRVGLPWILNDAGCLRLYCRAKTGNQNLLVRSVLDLDRNTLGEIETIGTFPRNPINIAITRRGNRYLIFYGSTVGGGFYVALSDDGVNFDFSNELMLIGQEHEWGWDYYKVCGSPDNTTDDVMTLCYLGGQPLAIGYGTAAASDIFDCYDQNAGLRPA